MGLSDTVYHDSKTIRIGDVIADFYSGGIRMITNLHSHIHEGKAFSYMQTIVSLANNGYMYFEFTTPEDDDMHLKQINIWGSEGPITIDIIERPTLTTGTTAKIPINLNRTRVDGSPLASGAVLKTNPTSISGGTSILGDPFRIGVNGIGVQGNAFQAGTEVERVLEKGENIYLLRAQNVSGGAIDLSINPVWYE